MEYGSLRRCELGVNGAEGKRMQPYSIEQGVQTLYQGSLPLYQPMSKGSPTPMLLLEICHAHSAWHNSQILEREGVCERQEQRSKEGSLHIFNKLLGEKQSVCIYPISCAINPPHLDWKISTITPYFSR